ncbi:PREDICTED: probable glycosyltransferase At3g07620 isoform X2 [Ipomoea nil]|uniref:probable glycosyltransferase At3g07620 isoform X2 n=1 Tax=Ipomoea nil TaxID=35883 RepID=UPI0009016AB1|nr:PREDICTED: probable glycosyltransferase At3g07620 isoform X2 [Ipomoea nil]
MARQCLCRLRWRVVLLPLSLFLAVATIVVVGVFGVGPSVNHLWPKTISVVEFSETGRKFQAPERHRADHFSSREAPPAKHLQIQSEDASGDSGPYHNWELFAADYEEMIKTLKIFVYPDVYLSKSSPLASVFLPHPDPSKQGNYFSEHMFKAALLRSSVQTRRPEDAHFFFMPFSINAMRNRPDLHSAAAISDFVAGYAARISSEFEFWNASGGADHFYAYCHSIGRTAASKHRLLNHNAIQVTCSSSYFQRMYISHKDVGLSQVWPRHQEQILNPPNARYRLAFYAGRAQNSRTRQWLIDLWKNDSAFDIFPGSSSFPYAEGFRRSKYCLHVKGYEVNTARVSDAIHYGCIPVLISNHYDLPFANVLDWTKFSVILNEGDIPMLKKILLSIPEQTYLNLYKNVGIVRKHFAWHMTPKNYDSFYMTVYQLWLRRGLTRVAW